jgi:hypothetical protein
MSSAGGGGPDKPQWYYGLVGSRPYYNEVFIPSNRSRSREMTQDNGGLLPFLLPGARSGGMHSRADPEDIIFSEKYNKWLDAVETINTPTSSDTDLDKAYRIIDSKPEFAELDQFPEEEAIKKALNTETPWSELAFCVGLFIDDKNASISNIEAVMIIVDNMNDSPKFECSKMIEYIHTLRDAPRQTVLKYINDLLINRSFIHWKRTQKIKKITLTGKGRSNNPGDVCVEFVDRSKEYFSIKTTSADRLKNVGWSKYIKPCMVILKEILQNAGFPTVQRWNAMDTTQKTPFRRTFSELFEKGNPNSTLYWDCIDNAFRDNIEEISKKIIDGIVMTDESTVYLYDGANFNLLPSRKNVVSYDFHDQCDNVGGLGLGRQACKSYKRFRIILNDGVILYYRIEIMQKGNPFVPPQCIIFKDEKMCEGGTCIFNKSGGGGFFPSIAGISNTMDMPPISGKSGGRGGSRRHKRKSRRRKTRRRK